MPRGSALLTPLLVAAVAVVAAVATIDVVGPDRRGSPSATDAGGPGDGTLRGALARLGARGALHYVDAACLRRSLSLPDLRPFPAQRVACTDELRARRPVAVSSFPDGRPRAGCRRAADHLVEGRRLLRRLPGCAQTADGRGASLRGRAGAIVARPRLCSAPDGSCERTVLAARDLRRAARRHPNVPASPAALAVSVRDVAWLGGRRHAVLLAAELPGRLERIGPQELLAVFDDRRLVWARPFLGAAPDGIAVSPRGTFVATTGVVSLIDREGRSLPVEPPFARGHAVAWSPDERLAAVATRAGILVVTTSDLLAHARTGTAPSLVRVPLAVRELAWASRG